MERKKSETKPWRRPRSLWDQSQKTYIPIITVLEEVKGENFKQQKPKVIHTETHHNQTSENNDKDKILQTDILK